MSSKLFIIALLNIIKTFFNCFDSNVVCIFHILRVHWKSDQGTFKKVTRKIIFKV